MKNFWKFALVIVTFVALGWIGLFVGAYILWDLQRQEKKHGLGKK